MKQKYYLRGLGIGILITAIVFIIAGPSELSEEEIIKRAEELGYTKVEEEVTPSIGIKELLEAETPAPTNTQIPSPTDAISITEAPTETPAPTETVAPTIEPTSTPIPANTPIPTYTPVPTQEPTIVPEETVITAEIVVERGNTATVVCRKIEEAGILEDGDALRIYLINNGLTDYINVGTYTLSSDMSIDEIANHITGR